MFIFSYDFAVTTKKVAGRCGTVCMTCFVNNTYFNVEKLLRLPAVSAQNRNISERLVFQIDMADNFFPRFIIHNLQ
jgi:hypothetical protein